MFVAIYFLSVCFVSFAISERRNAEQIEDSNPAEDPSFMACIDRENCGIFNKCSFSLHGMERNSSGEEGSEGVRVPLTVKGHILTVKNKMPYAVIFYWDVVGRPVPSGDDPNSRYKGKYARPGTITYVDTGTYGTQRIRVAVSKLGNDPDILLQPPEPGDLEFVQTLLTDDSECTRSQACGLLDKVCYMALQDDERCLKYYSVCNTFNNFDQEAKNACIPECVYTYWTEEAGDLRELDSDKIVQWIAGGGGSKDGAIDGFCNSGAVVALSVAFFIALVGLFFAVYLLYSWRRSYKRGETEQAYV